MSSTRYAPFGAPISYERYMSSPEFAELRGIPGTAIATKADLYDDPRQRSLLFFLHALSLKPGGLRRLARELSVEFSSFGEEDLTHHLVDLCINPKIPVRFSEGRLTKKRDRSSAQTLCDLLCHFREQYETRARADFVVTSIGQEIFDTLDHALANGRMVLIEGNSGIGKTTTAEAWCAAHEGESRMVSLSGISHKTGFFQKLASAMGLAASNRKATDMQIKVEEFFRRTRLMLVIDEAHYLWPQHQRSHSSPELVDWVNTALVNQQVPVGLICTDQFAKLKARVEKRTGWTSEQLEHRLKRYKELPDTPTKADLEAVAARLLATRWNTRQERWNLPGTAAPADFVNLVVGYALTCKMGLPAVADTIQEARYQARLDRREQIAARDIQKALLEYRIPSDAALVSAFESIGRRRSVPATESARSAFGIGVQGRCRRVA
jgi:hypothetical protein